MKTWITRIVFALLLILVTAVSGILWWLAWHSRISGEWREPIVQIFGANTGEVEAIDCKVLSYFYIISQSADLRNPYYLNKGNAWQTEITRKSHEIALGFETILIARSTGVLTYLPLSNHVTAWAHADDKLYLRSDSSYYSSDAINSFSPDTGVVGNVTAAQFTALNLEWIPLEPLAPRPPYVLGRYPQIEVKLRREWLAEPGPKNKYPATGMPD